MFPPLPSPTLQTTGPKHELFTISRIQEASPPLNFEPLASHSTWLMVVTLLGLRWQCHLGKDWIRPAFYDPLSSDDKRQFKVNKRCPAPRVFYASSHHKVTWPCDQDARKRPWSRIVNPLSRRASKLGWWLTSYRRKGRSMKKAPWACWLLAPSFERPPITYGALWVWLLKPLGTPHILLPWGGLKSLPTGLAFQTPGLWPNAVAAFRSETHSHHQLTLWPWANLPSPTTQLSPF